MSSEDPTVPLSRSIRRGPKITIACECGERAYLHYGERWTCPECSRTWDTNRIPLEQYAAIRSTQLRYRRVPVAVACLALIAIIAAVIAGKAVGGLLIVAVAATSWSMFVRPLHRRKYREALAKLPSWQIEPD